MIKKVNDIDINYIDNGGTGYTLVFLHGWGQNIEMMKMIGNKLQRENRVIILDLPGFGQSEEPKTVLTLYDYVDILNKLLNEIGADNPILIGHSFGGKIALLYASMYKVDKLILFGSPFKREIKNLSFKTKVLKSLKKVPVINKLEGFAKRHIGSIDYKSASDIMRRIMVEHVNLDITDEVKKIKCPTIIIWGTNDEAVPLSEAYELSDLISDSAVIEYQNCTHYAYLENFDQTVNIIKSFIGGNS